MDDDVDHVLVHDADVGLGVDGLRGAEEDVGKLGAAHGAAPAVAQAGAHGLVNQRLGEGGAAHMGHVHGLGDLAVNGAGLDVRLVPELAGVLRRAGKPAGDAEGLAVLHEGHLGDLVGQIVDVLVLGLHAPLLRDALELLGVLDLIGAVGAGDMQGVADGAAVVGVRRRAAGGEAQIVAADDAVHVAAADAAGSLGGDAAGAHGADAAAGSALAEAAVGRLVLDALLPGVGADLLAGLKQVVGRLLHLLNCD